MNMPTLSDMATTGIPDPWSEFGYSQWHRDALAVRRQWMEMMGLSDEEIDAHCSFGTEANLDEELAQYNAMFRIQEINEAPRKAN